MSNALIVGLTTCIISFIACIYLYNHLKAEEKYKDHEDISISQENSSQLEKQGIKSTS